MGPYIPPLSVTSALTKEVSCRKAEGARPIEVETTRPVEVEACYVVASKEAGALEEAGFEDVESADEPINPSSVLEGTESADKPTEPSYVICSVETHSANEDSESADGPMCPSCVELKETSERLLGLGETSPLFVTSEDEKYPDFCGLRAQTDVMTSRGFCDYSGEAVEPTVDPALLVEAQAYDEVFNWVGSHGAWHGRLFWRSRRTPGGPQSPC